MKPRDLRVKLADLDHANLPTIEQAREFMLDLPRDRADRLTRELADVQGQIKAEQEFARRDPIRDEIQWQEALDKAAIAKEKKERRFVELKERGNEEERAGGKQKQPGGREERVWPIHPPQHQSWPGFERAATETTRDDRTENLKGQAAKVWAAWRQSDSAKAFAAALDDKGIAFASVTGEEAYRSHREADFTRAVGNYSPRFKEGEIVIVTEQRPEYRREGEIVVPRRLHKLDQSLAEKFVAAIGQKGKLQRIEATLARSDERAYRRSEDNDRSREKQQDAANIRNLVDYARRTFKPAKVIPAGVRAVGTAGRAAGEVLEVVGGIVEGLFGAAQTPEQKRDGDAAIKRRADEASDHIDFSKYTTEAAQQRRHEQHDREVERSRERGGRA